MMRWVSPGATWLCSAHLFPEERRMFLASTIQPMCPSGGGCWVKAAPNEYCLKRKHRLLMMLLSIVASLIALVPLNASEGLFDGRCQRVVIGVEDEDSEQLCRLGLARVAADRMD